MVNRYADLDRPPLDAAALRRALVRPGGLWREVRVEASLGSTNAALLDLARSPAPEGLMLVTEHQTEGRGRLGRSWVTPPRAALTFSMLLRPKLPAKRWPWLPLLAGLSVAEALRRTAEVEAWLKWPNDVLVADHKIAGILAERVHSPTGPAAIVGVGLNVTQRREELPVAEATSLALEAAAVTDRTVLLRSVLRMSEALYDQWRREGGDPACGLGDAYRQLCATLGQRVSVQLPSGDSVAGVATDVDDDGRLLVDTGDRLVRLTAGDVVHLRRT